MLDTVNILTGSTFVTSDRHGDIQGTPTSPHGLFALDTRFLSLWRLTLDGEALTLLSADEEQYFRAQFFLAPGTGTTYVDSPVSVVRRRWIENGMVEQIAVVNHTPEPRKMQLQIEIAADFADLFEVKDALAKKGELYTRVEDGAVVLGYVREDYRRETRIQVKAENAQISDKAIKFDLDLGPAGNWLGEFRIEPIVSGLPMSQGGGKSLPELERKAADFRQSAPRVKCDWRPLELAYEKSIEDLDALTLELPTISGSMIPAAGLPWFMSLFGRDSVLTSYQALPFKPDLARSTLQTLARLQGTRVDDFRDEEPGKMPHELRFGELTAFEERPHSPYYGSADSTTLWLILLDEYERWTGREDVAREHEQAARDAIDWIDKYGDRDGDGYIEYDRRNKETGLENQCWKDSWDSIRFADGRMAELPRATCELQGYAYDAKMRTARLAREIWGDSAYADGLEASAADLKRRFNQDFWLENKGYFALALDRDKQKVDALTSNIGHLLWSGIVDDDKAASCVSHLMSPEMFSGWGIRTMAQGQGAYNPIGYHVGTVWPHDNSFIAMGLWRYGYRQEAARVAQAMIEASSYFRARLPEAFAGYPRDLTHFPAEYPTACSPQAWATGTPLLLMRAILGMQPQGTQLNVDPVLPAAIGQLDVSGIPGRWGAANVSADAATTLLGALESAAVETPAALRELFTRLDQGALPAATSASNGTHKSVGFRLTPSGDWLIEMDGGRIRVHEGFDSADCILEMADETLTGILRGSENARTAALAGKIKITGDFEIASKLGRAMAMAA